MVGRPKTRPNLVPTTDGYRRPPTASDNTIRSSPRFADPQSRPALFSSFFIPDSRESVPGFIHPCWNRMSDVRMLFCLFFGPFILLLACPSFSRRFCFKMRPRIYKRIYPSVRPSVRLAFVKGIRYFCANKCQRRLTRLT